MKKLNKISYLILLFLLLAIFIPVHALVVEDGTDGAGILYQTMIRPQDKFTVKWIHSVSKQPVIETYIVNEDLSIGIYEMIFNENGPNLPAGPENGTKWEIKDGYFRVYNYSLKFQKVPVRIGQVIADHTLIYKNIELPLKDISRPGGFVTLRVERMSFGKYIIGGVKLWLKTTFK
ncbi:MAG: DUF1850 domain-containing protein [Bacillota bacterium]